jgi:hypothetical protein
MTRSRYVFETFLPNIQTTDTHPPQEGLANSLLTLWSSMPPNPAESTSGGSTRLSVLLVSEELGTDMVQQIE